MVYIDQTIYTCFFCNDWEKHDYPGQKANLNLAFKASIKLSKFLCSKLMKIIFREGRKYSENIKNTLFIKNEAIIHKKNNWHCQSQKTSRILLFSDFVMWTARCILLGLVFCFSYTDYNFIGYLLSQIRICLYFLHRYLYLTLLQFRNQVDTSILIVCIILKF